jgi:Leucine-rich repeat (LRR) protein
MSTQHLGAVDTSSKLFKISKDAISRMITEEKTSSKYSLVLHNQGICKIECLGSFVKLRSIDLSFNSIEHIENLENLISLKELKLYQNKIEHIAGLDTNTQLENLILHGNQIAEIPNVFAPLKRLKVLRLDCNRLSSISNLGCCRSLVELNLAHNRLSSTRGIQSIISLERLNLADNDLRALDGLSDCKLLQELTVSSNFIPHCNCMPCLRDASLLSLVPR